MSIWVIQVLVGQVNCIFLTAPPNSQPQCGHTHSQIKSFLWGKVCDLGEVKRSREHTHRERKQWPSFSKTVTLIEKEFLKNCECTAWEVALYHMANNQPHACQRLVCPFCGERMAPS